MGNLVDSALKKKKNFIVHYYLQYLENILKIAFLFFFFPLKEGGYIIQQDNMTDAVVTLVENESV